ncbi:MAG: ketoacyl-ACP synthase III [Spirochaetes bacterium]|nr:ketoacyl-ACP synthase III [Spirochaetota bacterium]
MVRITGTGSYLPDKVISNKDLEQMVDTTNEWITQRTGIKERRVVAENQSTSDIATEAASLALKKAQITPQEVELIVLGTSTPDFPIPATAPIIQKKLGCSQIPAYDINSVCSSFMYALLNGYSSIKSGIYQNCLVIGADCYSRILNWQDRNTCVIFGDGAGAVVLQRDEHAKGVLSLNYGADGNGSHLITQQAGGSVNPVSKAIKNRENDLYFQMTGKKVYEFTISVIPKVAKKMIQDAGLNKEQIDWIILHQANKRIIESISKILAIDLNKFINNIEFLGNTSSASIPMALDSAVKQNKIKQGDKVMFLGFGGGLSWGGMIVEW